MRFSLIVSCVPMIVIGYSTEAASKMGLIRIPRLPSDTKMIAWAAS
jgi:hypothetical protein